MMTEHTPFNDEDNKMWWKAKKNNNLWVDLESKLFCQTTVWPQSRDNWAFHIYKTKQSRKFYKIIIVAVDIWLACGFLTKNECLWIGWVVTCIILTVLTADLLYPVWPWPQTLCVHWTFSHFVGLRWYESVSGDSEIFILELLMFINFPYYFVPNYCFVSHLLYSCPRVKLWRQHLDSHVMLNLLQMRSFWSDHILIAVCCVCICACIKMCFYSSRKDGMLIPIGSKSV